ncbi:MAG TPA: GAF domain-containing SpoIIE family protein phosphatase [Acidimicrobiales bacterium]|nr:GAF domain-containing SpoIIE family protein phosphatase [Acidimicrobiales bacterium]
MLDELRKLQVIMSALAAAPSEEAIADVIIDELLPAVGADAGVLALNDDQGGLDVRRAAGYGGVASDWRRIPLDAGLPLSEAARRGEPVFLSCGKARLEAFPATVTIPVLHEGLVALPLVVGGRPLGVLGLSFTESRHFDPDEQALLVTIAQLCALTIDRFQRGERLSRLQTLTGQLSRAFTVDEVVRVLRDEPIPGQAVRRGLWLLDEESGGLRLAVRPARDGSGPEESVGDRSDGPLVVPLDADISVAKAARTCAAVWLDGMTEPCAEFPSLAGSGCRSAAAIPLAAEDRVVGVLTVGFDDDRPPDDDDDDRRFFTALAEQGAVALERARLYDSERLSRRQAEQDRQRSVDLARALQISLLPPRLPDVPGLDLGARYHPALAGLEVGGDFYDVFDTGGDWAVVIGDVCGKGPVAAALTALARYTIRSVAMDLRHPAQVLRKLNDTLVHHQLDERFCTVAYGRVVPTVGGVRVSVCRGGHPPPLVVRSSGEIEPLGSDGGLIGLFPEIRLWEESAQLNPGDSLVFYTDGVTEANRGREQFGDERLEEVLRSCAGMTADEVAENVEAAVIDFGGPEPRDDLAVLVLHVPVRAP